MGAAGWLSGMRTGELSSLAGKINLRSLGSLTEKAIEPLCHSEKTSTEIQKNAVQGFTFAVRCKVRPGLVFPPTCFTYPGTPHWDASSQSCPCQRR